MRRGLGLTLSAGLVAAASMIAAGSAFAQVRPPAAATRPIDELSRQRVPGIPLRPSRDFDLRLQAPEKSGAAKAVDDLVFEVSRIKVTGSTVFSPAELDAMLAGSVSSRATLETLRAGADALQQAYRSRGYFLTRVLIPPQQVRDGVFEIQVIEGYISAVYVEGSGRADLRRRAERLTRGLTQARPVRLADLESALLILNDLPGVSAQSLLRQGPERGATEMVVALGEVPGSASVSFNNTGSKSVGPESLALNATFNGPFGRTGALAVGGSVGGDPRHLNELKGVTARYAFPVGPAGGVASVGGLLFYARPGDALEALDIGSLSTSGSLRFHQPLQRSRAASLYVDLGVAVNRSRTTLGGELLTLDKATVGELTVTVQQERGGGRATMASVSAFQGLPVLDASRGGDANVSTPGFNPSFLKLTANLQHTEPLPGGASLLLTGQAQWSNDLLPSAEQVSFGGPGIGRAYDPGSQSGIRGIGGGAEVRCACFSRAPPLAAAQAYAFVDGGLVWSRPSRDEGYTRGVLASAGVGVRIPAPGDIFIDLQYAAALKPPGPASAQPRARGLVSLAVSRPL